MDEPTASRSSFELSTPEEVDYDCRYCGSADVVPVLDKRMEETDSAGNKFRRHCLSCARWLPMCSERYFNRHSTPYILPVGAEPVRENLIRFDDREGDHSHLGRARTGEYECRQTPKDPSYRIHIQVIENNSKIQMALTNDSEDDSNRTQLDRCSLGSPNLDSDEIQKAWESAVLAEADYIRAKRHGWISSGKER